MVCNEEYRFITAEQLRSIGKLNSKIILEPFGGNTAPALTLAAIVAMEEKEDLVLLAMPADHVIENNSGFLEVVELDMVAAVQGYIITFGVVPTGPETAYGYIYYGFLRDSGYEILKFVEKPDFALANEYVKSRKYLWNSGLFMMRASVWHCSACLSNECRVVRFGSLECTLGVKREG